MDMIAVSTLTDILGTTIFFMNYEFVLLKP